MKLRLINFTRLLLVHAEKHYINHNLHQISPILTKQIIHNFPYFAKQEEEVLRDLQQNEGALHPRLAV
ncbi:CLUMA_CG002302, isoform A [Clunio marinus]|uniref:CLUMA_CG002302, isoform A n=1 Tax=Clunio marinus TaxID=568069 RepID=A0A1J1HQ09_9DIPT|nr:CLUMA_CG002302, isoform A [Clunio marinus]